MTGIFKKSYAAVAIAVFIVSAYFIIGVLALSGAQYNEINARNLEETVKAIGAFTPPEVFTNTESASAWTSALEKSTAWNSVASYRITLIRRNGQVVYDSDTDISAMENHLNRPEFQAAITGGIGIERRKSATMGQEYIYAAIGIDAAGVLRISHLVPTFTSYLLTSAPLFLIGAFLLILGSCAGLFHFSRSLSRSIEEKLDAKLKKKSRELIEHAKEAENEGRRLQAILNSMSEGVIALDLDLKIILVNPRVCFFFDVNTKSDFRGMTLLEFSSSLELENTARQVLSICRPLELTLKRYVSGAEQHLQVFAAPMGASPHGLSKGVVIVLSDISRMVKLEVVRRDFAANVSHELRTPIQVIKGFAENIFGEEDREKIRHFAEIITKNTLIMENLTNDLLTLVSLEEEGSNRPPMEDCILAPLIAEAADMAELAAGRKNISIETSCPQDLSAKLYGSLFVQALINLMDNAIKYSGPGSHIKVSAFCEGEQLIIEVKDEGIGIPAEHIGRIFERFYRVDKARQRAEAGTGLGLAIVRHIALLHQGSAEAESHAGEGSVFRLKLPIV